MAVFDPLERERLANTCADIDRLAESGMFPNSEAELTRKYTVLKIATAQR